MVVLSNDFENSLSNLLEKELDRLFREYLNDEAEWSDGAASFVEKRITKELQKAAVTFESKKSSISETDGPRLTLSIFDRNEAASYLQVDLEKVIDEILDGEFSMEEKDLRHILGRIEVISDRIRRNLEK